MKERIQTLDGLRFLAAIGVLWIHTWTEFKNPRYFIGKIDLANILALGGNGVDLFFVISGFCMYFFYGTKADFSYRNFYRFIKKRWVRLSPAFYVSAVVYAFNAKLVLGQPVNVLFDILHSIFYLNYFFGEYNVARHFWTLTIEWQFYFTIPFLLIYQNKIGFSKTFAFIFGAVFIAAIVIILALKSSSDVYSYTIFFRVTEFAAGVLAARVLIKNTFILKRRWLWLFFFVIVIFAGRILTSNPVLTSLQYYYNIYKLMGYAIMGLGFAGVLYLAVTSSKWLNIILGNRVFKTMGRISYSFYLFHILIYPIGVWITATYLPSLSGLAAPVAATLINTLLLYPVSLLSFNFLEKPFLSIGNLTTK